MGLKDLSDADLGRRLRGSALWSFILEQEEQMEKEESPEVQAGQRAPNASGTHHVLMAPAPP